MKYDRFEQLPVWQSAMDLAQGIYRLTENAAFNMDCDLRSQLRRAALSVSNNIAEGFERGTTAELLSFLYIARGSAGEARSMLHFAERYEGTTHLKSQTSDLKSQISNLKSLAESCSRQLHGWADSLQNCDIAGQRRLNESSRAAYESKRRAEAFLKHVDEVVQRLHPPQTHEQDR